MCAPRQAQYSILAANGCTAREAAFFYCAIERRCTVTEQEIRAELAAILKEAESRAELIGAILALLDQTGGGR